MRQGNLEFCDRFPGRFQPHAEHFCPRSVVVSLSQVRADCPLIRSTNYSIEFIIIDYNYTTLERPTHTPTPHLCTRDGTFF